MNITIQNKEKIFSALIIDGGLNDVNYRKKKLKLHLNNSVLDQTAARGPLERNQG